MFVKQFDDFGDLLGRSRKYHGQRPRFMRRDCVALIDQQLGLIDGDAVFAQNLMQPRDDF